MLTKINKSTVPRNKITVDVYVIYLDVANSGQLFNPLLLDSMWVHTAKYLCKATPIITHSRSRPSKVDVVLSCTVSELRHVFLTPIPP